MKKLLILALLFMVVNSPAGSEERKFSLLDLNAANEAWNEGRYAVALQGYMQLLNSPAGDRFLEEIALQTGELYQTEEITPDGRAPRFSPDGKLIAFEVGSGLAASTRILQVSAGHSQIAELPGTGAVFSPSCQKVAYLKLRIDDQLAKAQAALDNAPQQGAARMTAQQNLNLLLAKQSTIMLRDLQTQLEKELTTGNLLKSSLAFGADNETVYFVGGREGEAARNDIYAVSTAAAQASVVTDVEGFKTAPVVDPSGKVLLFSVPNQNPVLPSPRQRGVSSTGSAEPSPDTPPSQSEEQGQRPQQAGQGRPPGFGGFTKFGIVDLAVRKVTLINSTSFTLSADGSAVAYLTRSGQENSLMLLPIGGTAIAVLKTVDRLDAPAFSPDGQRLAYQKMTRDDWEIYTINRDGKEETRITREIQHDVLPRFIANDRILAMIGEPRHRRSYLYDLKAQTRTRLFHNNTVRTIVPEYSWMASPDALTVLISADRDGDTISAERGVYLVHLDRKISKADLLARLQSNLVGETQLQERSRRMFAPIGASVRRITDMVSVDRIFAYESRLYEFDSKHISRPGNRRAAEYLHAMYKSFGYAPEYQWFEARAAVEGKTANIVAILRGTENPDLVYVVSSHFDSNAACPGADDNGSGTAALLEAARVLAGKPLPATVIFASFTGEEAGLLGSREFVKQAQASKMKVVAALNNDMIGWTNDPRLDNTIRYTNAGIRDLQHAAALFFSHLIAYDTRYHRSTDATAFYEGFGDIVGGIGSYPVLGSPHYHTASDLLETVNHQLIAETCKTTVASIMLLASSPSPVKDLKVLSFSGERAEVAWTASPEKGVRSYLVSYGRAEGPQKKIKVNEPRAMLRGVAPGMVVAVKAFHANGLEGWAWTRTTLTSPPAK